MRKPILLLALLTSLLLILAACVPQTIEVAPESGSASMAESDSGDGDCMITIGAAVSETGKYAREGKDVRQGYNLWADWVNGDGGGIQMGDQICQAEIVFYDDESDPDTVARLVEKLVTEDEVDILLGPYSSSLTMSASAIAEKYDMIMVEGNGASESLFERGFKNLFAVLTPAGNYAESALKSLSELGAQTVVIAYEDTAFPTSVALGAEKWAEEYGMEVLAVETYPKDIADVSGIMAKFKELEPDVFVGGGHFNDALLFVRAAKELDFNPKAMVITVGPSNPTFVAEVGADAEYIIGPTQWERTMTYADEYFGTAEEYAQRYEAIWDEPPTYQAAESTATALALQLAIEAAGTTETAAVRDALNALDEVLFYGPVKFDETGKNAGKPMGAIQIQDGEIVVVAPSDSAVAELRYPMPPWNER
ncbi:amino acid ABC transporter substrate-binding protein [Chloroflexi bacterium TSY]|nr:amino acid ABC transporter substrate-binding protein [Chloroflexi bacterium TSY]